MPRRALLKFRNPDSTQDLNDRYKGLFNKGFFSGGTLEVVGSALKVDLLPFATAGSDGMFVREDSEKIRLDVVVGVKNYIVIRQEYISNSDPVVSIESLTEGEFNLDGPTGQKGANNPTLIVFGVVNVPTLDENDLPTVAVTQNMIETLESDIIDNIGRSEFRGLLEKELDLPGGDTTNRAGDFYIITDGSGDFPNIFSWNGVSWVNITNAQDVQDELESHRQNSFPDEIHLTDEQANAVVGSQGDPDTDNLFVTEQDGRLLTQDESDANVGNGLPLEDFGPSDSNRWISSSKVFAVPTELKIVPTVNTSQIELIASEGGYFIGYPDDDEAIAGTAQQWFNLYAEDTSGNEEYTNDEFNEVQITQVRFGVAGVSPANLLSQTTEIDPQTNGDDVGFFVDSLSLYLVLSNPITDPVRVAYGKRGSLGTLLPHLLTNRGPKGGQIDTRLVRLLFGTPNAQFEDIDIWDPTVLPGEVVAYNNSESRFVKADPEHDPNALDPIGVRGNFNNLIMEGLYTLESGSYTTLTKLYADKANPGSLTNIENEWFIGRAISTTQLLVNMNAFPVSSSEPTTPVSFPAGLFQSGLQAGETCFWNGAQFAKADIVVNLPLGIRGNDNNVIQSGKYVTLTGTPFVTGTRYYAGLLAGQLITAENDWFMGIGIDSTTLLVNANAVPIPAKWTEEHDSDRGYHKFKVGNDIDRDDIPGPVDGMLFIRDDLPEPSIEYYNGNNWVSASSSGTIPGGSKMLFIQDTVPTGWTLDVTANDRVIRVVNDAVLGGVTAGSWTISGISGDDHELSIEEMPTHDHDLRYSGNSSPGPGTFQVQLLRNNVDPQTSLNPIEDTGGGEAHGHTISSDGTWRPSYINAIICIKD